MLEEEFRISSSDVFVLEQNYIQNIHLKRLLGETVARSTLGLL